MTEPADSPNPPPDGHPCDLTISDAVAHALVENRVTFITATDTGVSIAIMAVEMLGKRQVTR